MTLQQSHRIVELWKNKLLIDKKLTEFQRMEVGNIVGKEAVSIEHLDAETLYKQLFHIYRINRFDELILKLKRLPILASKSKVLVFKGDVEYSYNDYLEHIHKWSKKGFSSLDAMASEYTEYTKEFRVQSEVGHEAELLHFGLQLNRLSGGLYTVRLKEGGVSPFKLNKQQSIIYSETTLVHPRMVLLKSRQTGASTLYLIKGLDDILTREAFEAGLQAQGLSESKSLKERADLAHKRLPVWFSTALGLRQDTSNKQEMAFSNGSKLRIATSFRSATLNSLHVSELGKIAESDPKKIEELQTGTMQAIKIGNQIVFESTARGEDNWFYELWEQSTENKLKAGIRDTDFNPVFLSVWDDDDCMLELPEEVFAKLAEEVPIEHITYLASYRERMVAELGREPAFEADSVEELYRFSFWIRKLKEFGFDISKMNQEYPDVPSAAFAASKDSSYYSSLLNEMVKDRGRVAGRVYDSGLDVYVAIDLGMNDTMVLVWFQVAPNEIRVIDAYGNSGEPISHYANILKRYPLKRLFLPHDAKVRDLSLGKSREQMFRDAGYTQTIVLSRTNSVQDDIEQVRALIPIMFFERGKTATLYKKLTKYRKKWDEVNEVFKNEPLHNEASNWADAFRYACMAIHKYLRVVETGRKRKPLKSNVIDGMAM